MDGLSFWTGVVCTIGLYAFIRYGLWQKRLVDREIKMQNLRLWVLQRKQEYSPSNFFEDDYGKHDTGTEGECDGDGEGG
jgi:hypothetical protein